MLGPWVNYEPVYDKEPVSLEPSGNSIKGAKIIQISKLSKPIIGGTCVLVGKKIKQDLMRIMTTQSIKVTPSIK